MFESIQEPIVENKCLNVQVLVSLCLLPADAIMTVST